MTAASPGGLTAASPGGRAPWEVPYFRGHAPALRTYTGHPRQLQKQAVLGRGELIERLLAGRRAALERRSRLPWLRRLSDATYRQMCEVLLSGEYAGFLPLRAADLMTLMELPLPFLADSTILARPIHAPAAEILPRLPWPGRRAAEVRRILDESYLDEECTFRSMPEPDGRLVVHGRDRATLEALAGIAHELGHCLYERARPVRSARGQLASERFAQSMEEQVTAVYLREWGGAEESLAWWAYQRRVDAVNLHFFAVERHLMYGPPDGVGPGPDLLRESVTAFRESLFTLPGYQVVYAQATLARLPGSARSRGARYEGVGA